MQRFRVSCTEFGASEDSAETLAPLEVRWQSPQQKSRLAPSKTWHSVGSHSTAGLGIGLIDRESIRLPVSAAREQPSRNAYRAATGLSWQMEVSEATSVASLFL
jgi:hypothetical protein